MKALCHLEKFEAVKTVVESLGNLDLPIYADIITVKEEQASTYCVSLVPFALRVLACEVHAYLGTNGCVRERWCGSHSRVVGVLCRFPCACG